MKRPQEKAEPPISKDRELLDQKSNTCELKLIMEGKEIDTLNLFKSQSGERLKEARQQAHAEDALQELRYKILCFLMIVGDYRIINLTPKKERTAENFPDFYTSTDEMLFLLEFEPHHTPKEKLYLYKMKVFLLALKLHATILFQEPKKLIMYDFSHFAFEMQNYKNLAEFARRNSPMDTELAGLVSDAVDLFPNTAPQVFRNYWCTYTMQAACAAIRYATRTNVNEFSSFDKKFISFFSNILSTPTAFNPKKNFLEDSKGSETFEIRICDEIIKIFLSLDKNPVFSFEKDHYYFLNLFFIRLHLLGLFLDEKNPEQKEILREKLLLTHTFLQNNLAWLALYLEFVERPSICFAIQSVINIDAALDRELGSEESIKITPKAYLTVLYSEISSEEAEIIEYFKKAKKNNIPFGPQKIF